MTRWTRTSPLGTRGVTLLAACGGTPQPLLIVPPCYQPPVYKRSTASAAVGGGTAERNIPHRTVGRAPQCPSRDGARGGKGRRHVHVKCTVASGRRRPFRAPINPTSAQLLRPRRHDGRSHQGAQPSRMLVRCRPRSAMQGLLQGRGVWGAASEPRPRGPPRVSDRRSRGQVRPFVSDAPRLASAV